MAKASSVIAQSARPAPLRLTRRGRVVLVLVPLLLLAAGAFLASALVNPPAAVSTSSQASGVVTVTVQPGETLWAIAARHDGERDTRQVVAELVSLNNLDSSTLRAGQRLYLPAQP